MNTTWLQLSRASVINFDLYEALFSNDNENLKLVNFTRILNNLYLFIFVIVGTIGNLIALIILNKILLAQENILRMLCVVNETIVLSLTLASNIFANYFINNSESSKLTCEVLSFGIHMFTDSTAWFMVAVGCIVYIKIRSYIIILPLGFKILIIALIYSLTFLINLKYFTDTDSIQVNLIDNGKNFTELFYVCGIVDESIIFKLNIFDFFKNTFIPVFIRLILYCSIRIEDNKVAKYGRPPSRNLFLSHFVFPVVVCLCKVPIFIVIFYNNLNFMNYDHHIKSFKPKVLTTFAFMSFHFTHMVIFLLFFHFGFRRKFIKSINYKLRPRASRVYVLYKLDPLTQGPLLRKQDFIWIKNEND